MLNLSWYVNDGQFVFFFFVSVFWRSLFRQNVSQHMNKKPFAMFWVFFGPRLFGLPTSFFAHHQILLPILFIYLFIVVGDQFHFYRAHFAFNNLFGELGTCCTYFHC
jgi:hypothetical protein